MLRVLLQWQGRNIGQRRVRPRTEGSTLGETNLKFTPYDCCSFQGERDVHLGSLLRFFSPSTSAREACAGSASVHCLHATGVVLALSDNLETSLFIFYMKEPKR